MIGWEYVIVEKIRTVNVMKGIKIYWLLFCMIFMDGLSVCAQVNFQIGEVDMKITEKGDSKFPEGFSVFSLENHFIWCGSAIRAEEDGKYYLFYSAMESGEDMPPFNDAWVLGSKIGVAVSDSPYGGYKNLGIIYNSDGYTPDNSSWDTQTVHNPQIKHFNGKYYFD